ncbi:MAG: hypothetical protein PHF29_07730 [Candidatus Riflebacteria bacterium]|nr:hypothetical protein [Candidatus Riflebacteria bacterium]
MKIENQNQFEMDVQKEKNTESIKNESKGKWLPSSNKLYIFKKTAFDSELVQCVYLPEKA